MFQVNDKWLKTCKKILDVAVKVLIAISIIAFIVLLIVSQGWYDSEIWIPFAVLAVMLLITAIVNLAGNLHISYLVDVKLIRNKLYNQDNEDLKVFLEKKLTEEEQLQQQATEEEKAKQKENLKNLLDSGIISKEEYDAEIAKLS